MFPSPYINRFHPHTSTQHRSTFLRRLSRGRGPIREYGFIAENGENCGEPQGGMPAENANCNPGHHPRNTVTLQRMATHRRWHETRPRLLMLIFKSIMNVCWRLLQLLFFFFCTSWPHCPCHWFLSRRHAHTAQELTTSYQDPLKPCLQMPVWRNDQRQFAEQWCVNSGEDTDVLRQRFHHRRWCCRHRCCCCCCCWVYLWSQGGLFPPTRLSWHFESPASRHFIPTVTGAVLNKTPGSKPWFFRLWDLRSGRMSRAGVSL